MTWESYQRAWSLHAQSAAFRRKRERSLAIIRQAMSQSTRMVVSLSGGKDSVAMAGLVEECGGAESMPLAHATSAFNFPDTMAVCESVAERLNQDFIVVEPDAERVEDAVKETCKHYGTPLPQPGMQGFDEWSLLEAIPRTLNIDEPEAMERILNVSAGGTTMVLYVIQADFDGSYVGLRADESKGRRWYSKSWGPIHKRALDDKTQVCPLLDWTALDVFAYCTARELPIHPYYRAAWEAGPMREPPDRIRVDLALFRDTYAADGGVELIRRIYPALFRRLSAIRPEIRRHLV